MRDGTVSSGGVRKRDVCITSLIIRAPTSVSGCLRSVLTRLSHMHLCTHVSRLNIETLGSCVCACGTTIKFMMDRQKHETYWHSLEQRFSVLSIAAEMDLKISSWKQSREQVMRKLRLILNLQMGAENKQTSWQQSNVAWGCPLAERACRVPSLIRQQPRKNSALVRYWCDRWCSTMSNRENC